MLVAKSAQSDLTLLLTIMTMQAELLRYDT